MRSRTARGVMMLVALLSTSCEDGGEELLDEEEASPLETDASFVVVDDADVAETLADASSSVMDAIGKPMPTSIRFQIPLLVERFRALMAAPRLGATAACSRDAITSR